MASSKLRSSCSIPNLLLSLLNFILFLLSTTSLAPIFLLKTPPTSLGYAFLIVSSMSIISSFIGFYSQLTHACFVNHLLFLIASSTGQLLTILALFVKENYTISSLKSGRDVREVKFLVRVECGVFMAMFSMQMLVLVLSCVVHSCWVREYEGLEEEREVSANKRGRRMARVQEESMANAEKIAEIKAIELDEKMNTKYGQLYQK